MFRGRGERGWEDAWPSCPPRWRRTWGDKRLRFPSVFSVVARILQSLLCAAVQSGWRGAGSRDSSQKGGKGWSRATRVPSWSFAAPVLPKLPPAECDFAIYLHVIIAMRCRY